MRAVKEIVIPIAYQYEPEFILVSAGFDSHYSDPVGNLSLSARCIQQVYEAIVSLASKKRSKLACVLEGGYNPNTIGQLTAAAVSRISGTPWTVEDDVSRIKKSIEAHGEKVIEEAKRVQRAFWKID
jgi:acetoin utilization deacetylase AcuC-like enzyme